MEAKYGDSNSREKNQKKIYKMLSRYWTPGLYERFYRDRSGNYTLKLPNHKELAEVYKTLRKYNEKDFYECNICGYGSCRGMAVAVFNGLNRPENCHHYNLALMEDDRETIDTLNEQILRQASAIEESSAAIEEMMATINNTAAMGKRNVRKHQFSDSRYVRRRYGF
jgi:hypothetical protein